MPEDSESDVPDFEMSALLTKGQREYLMGESEIEKKSAQERAIRARIRNRLYQSVLDLSILQQQLEKRDLEKAFEDPSGVIINASIFDNIDNALALLFEGSIVNRDGDISRIGQTESDLETVVAEAINNMYVREGKFVKRADVHIDIEAESSLEEVAEQDLDQLAEGDLMQLVRGGQISFEKYREIMEERLKGN